MLSIVIIYGNVHVHGPLSTYTFNFFFHEHQIYNLNINNIHLLSGLKAMSKKTETVPDILIYDDAALTAVKMGRVHRIYIVFSFNSF